MIEIKNSVKYLGMIFDKKLNFKDHIDHITVKAIKCGRALYPLLNRKSALNLKNKIMLYKMCIRPIMTYSCQAWFPKIAKSHIKKLQIIQNKNLKIIHNLNWRFPTDRLHNTYGHKTVRALMADLTTAFENQCQQSTNDLIRNLH